MLPYPSSPEFPAALKARRESLGMSRSALAREAKIHVVMPRRYEEPDCGEFARPRVDTTWLALNKALGYDIPEALLGSLAQAPLTPSTDGDAITAKAGEVKALSLAEAKAGLALTFGVDIDRIEITIRG
ncbi:MAG: helix-turn-helix transcriptional regulator [Pseudomonas sp.]|jgi:transcriptional regulator with XRE-family HTH domain|uniref:helix-turn-helix domain-containing protein n=1 Tax=Pseudomonas sp. TaxID=306 RepID=UPI001A26CE7B|nr:helix-turn-helix transcriptional regulator [Pseudomonas sp.]MBJ7374881.1 helix-turn-helix transcriptional regulator [Pseudomonas sp.]